MYNAGTNDFFWFFGVVEDLDDPLKIGRARVRIYNVHSFDEARVRKVDLPWAHVILPVTSSGFNEVGASPTGLILDSTVFGFFADGLEKQKPLILGTLPGIPQKDPELVDPLLISEDNHDVSRLARGINKLAVLKDNNRQDVENIEPPTNSTYRARYPFNKVFETKGGHVIELDDSPGAERIHIYYGGQRGGSYVEYSPGRKVDKINGVNIEINMIDKIVRVKGDYLLDIDGNYQTTVGGNMVVDVKGSILIQSGTTIDTKSRISTSIDAGLVLSTQAAVSTSMTTGGFMSVKTGTFMDITVGGAMNVTVGAAATYAVGGPFTTVAGGLISFGSADTISFGSAGSFFIATGNSIEFVAGNFFNVTPAAAIFMTAPVIFINS